MDDYAGRVLADRYRLPLPPSDEYELTESPAFDTYSGQEVLVRQLPLPEVVEAEVLDAEGLPEGFTARDGAVRRPVQRTPSGRGGTRRPADPVVRRAVEAAQAAAAVPDHPRLDQVFDVFAEGGSLWVVSELVAARPLAALLAEQPLTPYRAAEVAADVLLALRVLHAYGWVHRNITARTVLVCDDGRVMLTGLAVGAAEEALCGYDPVPPPEDDEAAPAAPALPATTPTAPGTPGPSAYPAPGRPGPPVAPALGGPGAPVAPAPGVPAPGAPIESYGPGGTGPAGVDPEAERRAAIQARNAGELPGPGKPEGGRALPGPGPAGPAGTDDVRAARAGAIAAYRAGARAAARIQEAQTGRAALPGARPAPDDGPAADEGQDPGSRPAPPGQIADPYGVRTAPWHGATPRPAGGPPPTTAQPPAASPPRALPAARDPHDRPRSGGSGAPGPYDRSTSQAQPGGRAAPDPYNRPHPDRPAAPGPYDRPRSDGSGAPGPYDRSTSQAQPGSPAAPGPYGRPAPDSRPAAQVPYESRPQHPAPGRWDEPAGRAPRRGPATALAAERARQARMAVVGPVTERWAPEQAGPVHENWQLAAPIGPATDLWALGALLFRAVQGHAPYPEESTTELVQIVCAEPPAFAEECGPLRPVVESLLRQDPTERIEFEELSGWLRSLVRSAPEPEAGMHVVAAPPPDTARLPIIRRRGELVRRRRAGLPAHHGRHKRAREEAERSPRSLGRTLLLLVLLVLAGAVAYAMFFMPKSDTAGSGAGDRTGAAGEASRPPPERSPDDSPSAEPSAEPSTRPSAEEPSGATEPQSNVPDGFTLRQDPEGFRLAVADGFRRTPRNGSGQVVYTKGAFELLVVPGRDSAGQYGTDPMAYQRDKERELQPYRDSSWATSSGLKTIEVGGRTMAEGQFTWTGSGGGELFVRNVAMLIDGRYHIVQVRGPEAERDQVTRIYEQASASYRYTR
ncbi:protein kinase [Streptomyces sp. NPDC003717]|uniref:protein kinase n=1 Tax=Streptomyces sp. NPDC003717 TaxID=3154276 RepID=UPI0033A74E6E